MDRLFSKIRESCPQEGVPLLDPHAPIINHTMFADDVALVAPSPDGLQRLLHVVGEFCAEVGMSVNAQKHSCCHLSTGG